MTGAAPAGPTPTRPLRHPPPPVSSGPLGVLSNRRFLSLWLSQVSSQVGGNMVLYGLTVLVYGKTGSNSAVSFLILTFLVPSVLFSVFAGVYVDRFDRRLILIATNLVRAVAFVAMALVSDQIGLVYALNIFVSTATTFFAPAELAMIPAVVEREKLLQATALFNLTMNGAFAIGFALLGPLVVNLLGPEVLLFVVAATYLVAAGLCVTLPKVPRAEHGPAGEPASGGARQAMAVLGEQLREGLAYIRAHPRTYWSLTYLVVTASVVGVLGSLGPSYAKEVLGLTESDFVVVVIPMAAGIVTGILILNAYGRFLPRRRVIEGGLIALSVLLAILSGSGPISRFLQSHSQVGGVDISGVVSLLSVVIVIAFFAGTAYSFVAIPAQAQLQEELDEDVRGRVFGVLNTLVSIASFLPILIVGTVSDAVGTSPVLLATAVLIGVAGVGSIIAVHPTYVASAAPAAHLGPLDPVTAVGEYEVDILEEGRMWGAGPSSEPEAEAEPAAATDGPPMADG